MTINCSNCGNPIELPDGIVDGQHIRCPYCGEKFEYTTAEESKPLGIPKNNETVNVSLPKVMRCFKYVVKGVAVICGIIAAYQFIDGFLNLPPFYKPPSGVVYVSEKEIPVALVSIGKMFAGYFFAKVSRRIWRCAK